VDRVHRVVIPATLGLSQDIDSSAPVAASASTAPTLGRLAVDHMADPVLTGGRNHFAQRTEYRGAWGPGSRAGPADRPACEASGLARGAPHLTPSFAAAQRAGARTALLSSRSAGRGRELRCCCPWQGNDRSGRVILTPRARRRKPTRPSAPVAQPDHGSCPGSAADAGALIGFLHGSMP